ATTMNNIANIEKKIGDTDSAKKNYKESLNIKRKLPETPQYLHSLATTLYYYADLEETLGDTNSAKKHFEEGLEIAHQINNERYINFFERRLLSL
ncbi:MAG: tetratricopeptide repeat protein, partial [Bacteroidales bacterium]|nr:tetratricopeptide repeat protein [Bacteroidales bacterium]